MTALCQVPDCLSFPADGQIHDHSGTKRAQVSPGEGRLRLLSQAGTPVSQEGNSKLGGVPAGGDRLLQQS